MHRCFSRFLDGAARGPAGAPRSWQIGVPTAVAGALGQLRGFGEGSGLGAGMGTWPRLSGGT